VAQLCEHYCARYEATFKRPHFLQQVDELTHGNSGLSKNRRERPSGEFPVIRDNDRSALLISKFHVITPLPNLFETDLPKRRDGLLAGSAGLTQELGQR
jgi:hypothetical protein